MSHPSKWGIFFEPRSAPLSLAVVNSGTIVMDCRCNSLQISVVDVKGLTNLLFIFICRQTQKMDTHRVRAGEVRRGHRTAQV